MYGTYNLIDWEKPHWSCFINNSINELHIWIMNGPKFIKTSKNTFLFLFLQRIRNELGSS